MCAVLYTPEHDWILNPSFVWLSTDTTICAKRFRTLTHSHNVTSAHSLIQFIHTHTHTGMLTRTQSLSIYPVNLSRTLYTSVRAVPKKTIHIENAHEHSSCQQRERETEHTACGRKTNGKAMWWWWSIVIVVCVYQVNVFLSRGQRLSNQMSRFQIST